eukprot:6137742-Prymnesium_polylepis.2
MSPTTDHGGRFRKPRAQRERCARHHLENSESLGGSRPRGHTKKQERMLALRCADLCLARLAFSDGRERRAPASGRTVADAEDRPLDIWPPVQAPATGRSRPFPPDTTVLAGTQCWVRPRPVAWPSRKHCVERRGHSSASHTGECYNSHGSPSCRTCAVLLLPADRPGARTARPRLRLRALPSRLCVITTNHQDVDHHESGPITIRTIEAIIEVLPIQLTPFAILIPFPLL